MVGHPTALRRRLVDIVKQTRPSEGVFDIRDADLPHGRNARSLLIGAVIRRSLDACTTLEG